VDDGGDGGGTGGSGGGGGGWWCERVLSQESHCGERQSETIVVSIVLRVTVSEHTLCESVTVR
jgi:hypothetical protein